MTFAFPTVRTKSCTTTAYRWLFRASLSSLRTLWSAVIKSPTFSARSTAFANASSAKSPCHCGSLADFAISIFWEMSINNVLFGGHFCRPFLMRSVCGYRHFYIFYIFSFQWAPLTIPGKSRTRSPEARLFSLVLFVLSVFGESRHFPGDWSSLRSVAGLEVVLTGPAIAM